jgi:hypothetical protein
LQEWSIAEVIRRGAEHIATVYPKEKVDVADGWRLMPPVKGRLLVTDPAQLRDLARADEERGV